MYLTPFGVIKMLMSNKRKKSRQVNALSFFGLGLVDLPGFSGLLGLPGLPGSLSLAAQAGGTVDNVPADKMVWEITEEGIT